MPKVVAVVLVGSFWACPPCLVGDVPKATTAKVVNYQQLAERMPWRWSDREASLTCSSTRHLADDEVEIVPSQAAGYQLTIRLKAGGQEVHAFEGHGETVCTRWGDRLYLADFHPCASGCTIVAINLKTGERLWQTLLRGLGPVDHSKYRNRVNIATDGKVITVWGHEAFGRYVELLDRTTGRTVGHKVFPQD